MAKSLIRQRRDVGAVCSHCQSPDYKLDLPEPGEGTKPGLVCGSCGATWCYGQYAGVYGELLTEPEKVELNKWIYGGDPQSIQKYVDGVVSNWDPINEKWVEVKGNGK